MLVRLFAKTRLFEPLTMDKPPVTWFLAIMLESANPSLIDGDMVSILLSIIVLDEPAMAILPSIASTMPLKELPLMVTFVPLQTIAGPLMPREVVVFN